jgi:hypothetical protein
MSEPQLAPSWDGGVVLDIGVDVGALVLRTPASMVGDEIDLVPDEPPRHRTHSAVRERRHGMGDSYAAVYPSLKAGAYTVERSGQRVVIVGGVVTDIEFTTTELDSNE